jgi:hypothetical protein
MNQSFLNISILISFGHHSLLEHLSHYFGDDGAASIIPLPTVLRDVDLGMTEQFICLAT